MHEKLRRRAVRLCSADDCRHHAAELLAALNFSVDPCDDFQAFVCGSWERRRSNRSALVTHHDRTTQTFMERAIGKLLLQPRLKEGGSSRRNSTEGLASLLFHSCIRNTSSNPDASSSTATAIDLQPFKKLKQTMRLTWPEVAPAEDTTRYELLDILLGLAIHWNENFLFDVLLVNVSTTPLTLYLTCGRPLAAWDQYQEPDNYAQYVETYLNLLGLKVRDEDSLQLLRNVTRDILGAKVDCLKEEHNEISYRLDLLGPPAPWNPARDWLSLLNKHFSPDMSWSSDNWIVFERSSLVETFTSLQEKYSPRELLIGLSWVFIQSYLWLIVDMPRIRFGSYGNLSVDSVFPMKKWSCLDYVHSRLGFLFPNAIQAPFVRPDLGVLENLKRSAQTLIEKLPWIGSARQQALQKIRSLTTSPTPLPEFFDVKSRDKLLETFPRLVPDFGTNFVRSSSWFKHSRRDRHRLGLYGHRSTSGYAQASYIYALNSVLVKMEAFQAPLYYANSTIAVLNAGAASMLSREVSRVFDPRGSEVDGDGRRVVWWGPNKSRDYSDRLACDLNASECCTSIRLFPAVPGLEIAYQAFQEDAHSDSRGPAGWNLAGLDNLTDTQVFFITYCYAQCGQTLNGRGDYCNVPLRNFPPFSRAFKCRVDSRMNPAQKCAFFPS
ncbi:neprilysin-like isoform X2 [Haemaphysalis longicornis]